MDDPSLVEAGCLMNLEILHVPRYILYLVEFHRSPRLKATFVGYCPLIIMIHYADDNADDDDDDDDGDNDGGETAT